MVLQPVGPYSSVGNPSTSWHVAQADDKSHNFSMVTPFRQGVLPPMNCPATPPGAPPEPALADLLALFEGGAIVIDAGGRPVAVGEPAAAVLACSPSDLPGSTLWEAPWHWRDSDGRRLDGLAHPLASACREGRDAAGEFALALGSAPVRHLICRCRPIPARSGEWRLLTLQPAAASDLASDDACHALLDRLPIPLWTRAEHAPHRHINQAWREACGNHGDLAWADTVHPADQPSLERAYRSLREGGPAEPTPFRMRGADGEYHWFLEHVSHRPATASCPAGYLGLAVDIGLLRQHDDAIRTLSRALEQTDARIVITDPHGNIEYVNAACCEAYGYARDELIGRNPRLFKSGETPDEVYRRLWATLMAGDTWRGELTNKTRDGRFLIEAVTISPVRDEQGQPRHFVAVKEDVTHARATARAQREADARLAQLERMRTVDALAGGVAHEFNNILVAILGYSDLGVRVMNGGGDTARVSHYLGEIRRAGERARALVSQLRAFGRSAGHATAHVALPTVLGDLAALMTVILPTRLQFEVSVSDALPELKVDRGAIEQVLLNLCLNARDAMPDGGRIRVSATPVEASGAVHCDACQQAVAGRFVAITVEDEGPGFPPDALGRLFEPFFSTKDPATATGLGLSVAHGIVHRHEGHLLLDRSARRGAAISVLLPVPVASS